MKRKSKIEAITILAPKHFELFKAECEKNLKRLGLNSWKVYYQQKNLDNSFGRADWSYEGRVATITLATEFPRPYKNLKQQIKETALHECLEILLSPISDLAGNRSFVQSNIDKEIHCVIRTLEKLLCS
jgi:hypothetical protein